MSSDLYYACVNNRGEEALRLLATASSADVNYRDWVLYNMNCLNSNSTQRADYQNGDTPLHRAAYENALNVAVLLIEKGADLHATQDDVCTHSVYVFPIILFSREFLLLYMTFIILSTPSLLGSAEECIYLQNNYTFYRLVYLRYTRLLLYIYQDG